MERQAATDLVERHRATAFRKGYMVAKGTQRTPRFRETCKVEELLTSQIVEVMTRRNADRIRNKAPDCGQQE